MVLVDTSVWVGHLRIKSPILSSLLDAGQVLMHAFVFGELACGNLKNRPVLMQNLRTLPRSIQATHEETLHLIDRHHLWGTGIGWTDAHLIASAVLTGCPLWTLDSALNSACQVAGGKPYRAEEPS